MDPLVQPIVQYGFAGLCGVLLVILVWLIREFLTTMREQNEATVALTKQTTDVVRDNSEAIREVRAVEERQVEVLTKLHDELLKRPCLLPKTGER